MVSGSAGCGPALEVNRNFLRAVPADERKGFASLLRLCRKSEAEPLKFIKLDGKAKRFAHRRAQPEEIAGQRRDHFRGLLM